MPDPVDPLVTEVLNKTKAGENELNTRRTKYDKSYEIYRTTRKKPKELDAWQSDYRVPWAMYTIDTEMVNIVTGNKPQCRVSARSPHFANNAKWMQAVQNYFTDRQHLAELQTPVTQQGLIYGLTIGKTGWDYQLRSKMMNVPQYGPGGEVSWMPQRVATCDYDGPYIQPWSVYDAWWDPAGSSIDTCRWVALRAYLSAEDLKMNACTVEHDHYPEECNGQFHNVDDLLRKGPSSKKQATSQDRFLSADVKAYNDLFEIVEYWWDDRLIVIGEKTVLLRDIDNPHWHGKKPIVAAVTRPDVFKMQGIPESETIDALQSAMWTVHNGRMDNFLLTIMRGFTVRETSVIDPKTTKITPRAMIPVTDHDDLRPIELPPLPTEAYREEGSLLGFMQQITGVSPYVSGANLSSVDQNTATGISVLSEVASRLLRFKAGQLHWNYWTRVFEYWGQDTQQFLTKPTWMKIVNPDPLGTDKYSWATVGPAEVAGDFDYATVGTEESLSQQQQRNDAMALLNALAPFAPLNIIDWKPILVKVAEAFDFDNPEELFQAPPPQAPAAPGEPPPNGADGGQGGSPPGAPPVQTGPQAALANGSGLDPRLQAVLANFSRGNRGG